MRCGSSWSGRVGAIGWRRCPGGETGSGEQQGCDWSIVFAPDLDDVPYGTSPGPMPHPDADFALLLCNGEVVRAIWVAPDDVIDLDAAAAAEAERYLEDVLVPDVASA